MSSNENSGIDGIVEIGKEATEVSNTADHSEAEVDLGDPSGTARKASDSTHPDDPDHPEDPAPSAHQTPVMKFEMLMRRITQMLSRRNTPTENDDGGQKRGASFDSANVKMEPGDHDPGSTGLPKAASMDSINPPLTRLQSFGLALSQLVRRVLHRQDAQRVESTDEAQSEEDESGATENRPLADRPTKSSSAKTKPAPQEKKPAAPKKTTEKSGRGSKASNRAASAQQEKAPEPPQAPTPSEDLVVDHHVDAKPLVMAAAGLNGHHVDGQEEILTDRSEITETMAAANTLESVMSPGPEAAPPTVGYSVFDEDANVSVTPDALLEAKADALDAAEEVMNQANIAEEMDHKPLDLEPEPENAQDTEVPISSPLSPATYENETPVENEVVSPVETPQTPEHHFPVNTISPDDFGGTRLSSALPSVGSYGEEIDAVSTQVEVDPVDEQEEPIPMREEEVAKAAEISEDARDTIEEEERAFNESYLQEQTEEVSAAAAEVIEHHETADTPDDIPPVTGDSFAEPVDAEENAELAEKLNEVSEELKVDAEDGEAHDVLESTAAEEVDHHEYLQSEEEAYKDILQKAEETGIMVDEAMSPTADDTTAPVPSQIADEIAQNVSEVAQAENLDNSEAEGKAAEYGDYPEFDQDADAYPMKEDIDEAALSHEVPTAVDDYYDHPAEHVHADTADVDYEGAKADQLDTQAAESVVEQFDTVESSVADADSNLMVEQTQQYEADPSEQLRASEEYPPDVDADQFQTGYQPHEDMPPSEGDLDRSEIVVSQSAPEHEDQPPQEPALGDQLIEHEQVLSSTGEHEPTEDDLVCTGVPVPAQFEQDRHEHEQPEAAADDKFEEHDPVQSPTDQHEPTEEDLGCTGVPVPPQVEPEHEYQEQGGEASYETFDDHEPVRSPTDQNEPSEDDLGCTGVPVPPQFEPLHEEHEQMEAASYEKYDEHEALLSPTDEHEPSENDLNSTEIPVQSEYVPEDQDQEQQEAASYEKFDEHEQVMSAKADQELTEDDLGCTGVPIPPSYAPESEEQDHQEAPSNEKFDGSEQFILSEAAHESPDHNIAGVGDSVTPQFAPDGEDQTPHESALEEKLDEHEEALKELGGTENLENQEHTPQEWPSSEAEIAAVQVHPPTPEIPSEDDSFPVAQQEPMADESHEMQQAAVESDDKIEGSQEMVEDIQHELTQEIAGAQEMVSHTHEPVPGDFGYPDEQYANEELLSHDALEAQPSEAEELPQTNAGSEPSEQLEEESPKFNEQQPAPEADMHHDTRDDAADIAEDETLQVEPAENKSSHDSLSPLELATEDNTPIDSAPMTGRSEEGYYDETSSPGQLDQAQSEAPVDSSRSDPDDVHHQVALDAARVHDASEYGAVEDDQVEAPGVEPTGTDVMGFQDMETPDQTPEHFQENTATTHMHEDTVSDRADAIDQLGEMAGTDASAAYSHKEGFQQAEPTVHPSADDAQHLGGSHGFLAEEQHEDEGLGDRAEAVNSGFQMMSESMHEDQTAEPMGPNSPQEESYFREAEQVAEVVNEVAAGADDREDEIRSFGQEIDEEAEAIAEQVVQHAGEDVKGVEELPVDEEQTVGQKAEETAEITNATSEAVEALETSEAAYNEQLEVSEEPVAAPEIVDAAYAERDSSDLPEQLHGIEEGYTQPNDESWQLPAEVPNHEETNVATDSQPDLVEHAASIQASAPAIEIAEAVEPTDQYDLEDQVPDTLQDKDRDNSTHLYEDKVDDSEVAGDQQEIALEDQQSTEALAGDEHAFPAYPHQLGEQAVKHAELDEQLEPNNETSALRDQEPQRDLAYPTGQISDDGEAEFEQVQHQNVHAEGEGYASDTANEVGYAAEAAEAVHSTIGEADTLTLLEQAIEVPPPPVLDDSLEDQGSPMGEEVEPPHSHDLPDLSTDQDTPVGVGEVHINVQEVPGIPSDDTPDGNHDDPQDPGEIQRAVDESAHFVPQMGAVSPQSFPAKSEADLPDREAGDGEDEVPVQVNAPGVTFAEPMPDDAADEAERVIYDIDEHEETEIAQSLQAGTQGPSSDNQPHTDDPSRPEIAVSEVGGTGFIGNMSDQEVEGALEFAAEELRERAYENVYVDQTPPDHPLSPEQEAAADAGGWVTESAQNISESLPTDDAQAETAEHPEAVAGLPVSDTAEVVTDGELLQTDNLSRAYASPPQAGEAPESDSEIIVAEEGSDYGQNLSLNSPDAGSLSPNQQISPPSTNRSLESPDDIQMVSASPQQGSPLVTTPPGGYIHPDDAHVDAIDIRETNGTTANNNFIDDVNGNMDVAAAQLEITHNLQSESTKDVENSSANNLHTLS